MTSLGWIKSKIHTEWEKSLAERFDAARAEQEADSDGMIRNYENSYAMHHKTVEASPEEVKDLLARYKKAEAGLTGGTRSARSSTKWMGKSVPRLPLAVHPEWSQPWPAGICPECGSLFELPSNRRWCSSQCSTKARRRANGHNERRRKALQRLGRTADFESYETVGKLELLTAFRHRCGKCGLPLALQDVWIGHILGVEHGGQHTRANIAPVHKACEQQWNADQRLSISP